MSKTFAKIVSLSKKYPIMRGMASYAIIWPVGCLFQQTIAGKTPQEWDFIKAARFSLYGCCVVAPSLHVWIKLASAMWPEVTLGSAITKALVEQISYGPFAMVCFFFGMTLLEGKPTSAATAEVQNKFIPTYKVGMCVWPVLQTINFWLIPARNRVPFVSLCSFMWTSFLAYMKQLETPKTDDESEEKETDC